MLSTVSFSWVSIAVLYSLSEELEASTIFSLVRLGYTVHKQEFATYFTTRRLSNHLIRITVVMFGFRQGFQPEPTGYPLDVKSR